MKEVATGHGGKSLFELPALRTVTGSIIRPGGFSLTDRAIEVCGLAQGARVADIGCGDCGTVEHLLDVYKIRAFGLDPSPLLLASGLRRVPGLPVMRAVAASLPFRAGVLDGLVCECVLSLLPDAEVALMEMSRVLRPGGVLAISDLYRKATIRKVELDPLPTRCCLQGALSRDQVEQLLMRHRFSLLLWEDHTRLLKELVVQLIFAHGSLDCFWDRARAEGVIQKETPMNTWAEWGYCLWIAHKPMF